jgi:hypothetical protein
MESLLIVMLFIGTVACMLAADRLARWKHRSPRGWVVAAVLFGPLPLLVLPLVPERQPGGSRVANGQI